MPNLNITIASFLIDTSWVPLVVSQSCQDVELYMDSDWDWCTNLTNVDVTLSYRTVGAFIREPLLHLSYPAWLGMNKQLTETLCYIRSHNPASRAWLKTVISG